MPILDKSEIEQRLRTMAGDAKAVQNFIEELEGRIAGAEEALRQAEELSELARTNQEKAEEKYKKAVKLQKGEYAELISDIFESPKEELFQSIKRWSKLGQQIALIGVVVTVFFALFAVAMSYKNATDVRKEIADIKNLEITIRHLLKVYSLSDDSALKMRAQIATKWERFNNLSTINDISLAFKIDLTHELSPQYYDHYLATLSVLNTGEGNLLTSNMLRNWDSDMAKLYGQWLGQIERKNGTVAEHSEDRYWSTFKAKGDNTVYGSWRFPSDSLTYEKLRDRITQRKNSHEKQIEKNADVMAPKDPEEVEPSRS